jgi:hypothetical protein
VEPIGLPEVGFPSSVVTSPVSIFTEYAFLDARGTHCLTLPLQFGFTLAPPRTILVANFRVFWVWSFSSALRITLLIMSSLRPHPTVDGSLRHQNSSSEFSYASRYGPCPQAATCPHLSLLTARPFSIRTIIISLPLDRTQSPPSAPLRITLSFIPAIPFRSRTSTQPMFPPKQD